MYTIQRRAINLAWVSVSGLAGSDAMVLASMYARRNCGLDSNAERFRCSPNWFGGVDGYGISELLLAFTKSIFLGILQVIYKQLDFGDVADIFPNVDGRVLECE